MFFDTSQFPFVRHLEDTWAAVKRECLELAPTQFTPWPERHVYDEGWDVLALYAYGKKIERFCFLCPRTTRLVESIPGMVTAGFSRLAPGTHIRPHQGYSNALLRCHMGLIVPTASFIRVGDDTRKWQEGRCLIFDDLTEHEAWNKADSHRTILLVDFERRFHLGATENRSGCLHTDLSDD